MNRIKRYFEKYSFGGLIKLLVGVVIVITDIIDKINVIIFIGLLLITFTMFNKGECSSESCRKK